MSVMIGGVTERIAPDSNFMTWDNETNGSTIDTIARDEERVRVAAAVTLLSGLFQVNTQTRLKFPFSIPTLWRYDDFPLSSATSFEQMEMSWLLTSPGINRQLLPRH